MGVQLDDIPGLKDALAEAREREDTLRSQAFIDTPFEICGVDVEQFKPRHLQTLCLVRSPFFYRREEPIGPEDIAMFFWIVSPEYSPGDRETRDLYLGELLHRLPTSDVVIPKIDEYLAEAFFDEPEARSGPASDPIACMEALLVHEFGAAYRWTPAQTLNTPFAQLYQLLRLIRRDEAARQGRRVAFINRISSKVKRLFVKSFLESEKAKSERLDGEENRG